MIERSGHLSLGVDGPEVNELIGKVFAALSAPLLPCPDAKSNSMG